MHLMWVLSKIQLTREPKLSFFFLQKEASTTATMEELSDITGLSRGSSRAEHMAYFTESMGLDASTAALLYRAEHLQEKGQHKLALKYYQKVLQTRPDCVEAAENARITAETIEEQNTEMQKAAPQVVPEKAQSVTYTTTEMEVSWFDSDNAKWDTYADPDEAARRAARAQLIEMGHRNSPLKMIKNKVIEKVCNAETGWETCMRGIAVFQVTLVPDQEDKLARNLEEIYFRRVMENANEKTKKATGDDPVPGSLAGDSRFADADNNP